MKKVRVFLVEDDEFVAGIIREGVEGQGWELRHQDHIEGAVEALREFSADILLLDLNLPDGEGHSVLQGLRADKDLAHLPVIVLTVKGGVESRLKAFAGGAQDYVIKPFIVAELLARMRAQLSIKGRHEALQREAAAARMAERVRQDVMDMIVHDLRTPLATIRTTIELVKRYGAIEKEPFNRYIDFAEDSVDFALFMVNDLLDLSSGSLPVMPAALDLGLLRSRLEGMLALQFETRGVELRIDLRDEPGFKTDMTLLFRILLNLLTNSLKFSVRGGEVVLSSLPEDKTLRFEVVDQGPGIPDAEKESVFDKFYRSRLPTSRSKSGWGIGLAFCRMAAQALRGRVWIEDAPASAGSAGGSRFVVEIPSL